ncbi:hypothetical protein DUNSADRAFT_6810 [Dunaliella salina]|uniref:Secreted protein n=1 Tax=Dunaliella salina TaxID=3046 RepID=A0ABQ7GMN2_DUNSA|nr:hypothetical protein DUNSADRAFT_6810 [Dunaliella salina]|eukprot:KAF5835877.1 hypothetical protein DUNSADRAFT_6810 [Dunaliella salina]
MSRECFFCALSWVCCIGFCEVTNMEEVIVLLSTCQNFPDEKGNGKKYAQQANKGCWPYFCTPALSYSSSLLPAHPANLPSDTQGDIQRLRWLS